MNREEMKQALITAGCAVSDGTYVHASMDDVLAALRASAAPEEGMTEEALLGWINTRWNFDKGETQAVKHVVQDILSRFTVALSPDSRKAEPVAWGRVIDGKAVTVSLTWTPANDEPLYAALAPATEDGGREIAARELCRQEGSSWRTCGPVARARYFRTADAVLAALSPAPSVGTPEMTSANRGDAA